ncbi:MAG: hypothetical protein AAF619_10310 [Pseudomonadota bacterium]
MMRALTILISLLFVGHVWSQDIGVQPHDLPRLTPTDAARETVPANDGRLAQSQDQSPERVGPLLDALENGDPVLPNVSSSEQTPEPQGNAESDELFPDVAPDGVLDADGLQAQRDAFRGYYQYRIDGYAHRGAVFRWQLQSGQIIFGLVIIIVALGMYFSWTQFHHGLQRGKDVEASTVEISVGSGIKVTSPVLGVIILALSLGFFYLYLVHVYPIEEIF